MRLYSFQSTDYFAWNLVQLTWRTLWDIPTEMEVILSTLISIFSLVYIEDGLVFSCIQEDEVNYVWQVLTLLDDDKIILSPESPISTRCIIYLGYINPMVRQKVSPRIINEILTLYRPYHRITFIPWSVHQVSQIRAKFRENCHISPKNWTRWTNSLQISHWWRVPHLRL